MKSVSLELFRGWKKFFSQEKNYFSKEFFKKLFLGKIILSRNYFSKKFFKKLFLEESFSPEIIFPKSFSKNYFWGKILSRYNFSKNFFFKKLFLERIILTPKKVPNCQISFHFSPPGNIPLKSGKDFLSKSNLTVWNFFGAGKILSRYNFSKKFFLKKLFLERIILTPKKVQTVRFHFNFFTPETFP